MRRAGKARDRSVLESTVRERPTPERNTLPGVPLTADPMFLDRHVGHNAARGSSDGHGWPSAEEGMDARERPAFECRHVSEGGYHSFLRSMTRIAFPSTVSRAFFSTSFTSTVTPSSWVSRFRIVSTVVPT
jgi:hypothetical protein